MGRSVQALHDIYSCTEGSVPKGLRPDRTIRTSGHRHLTTVLPDRGNTRLLAASNGTHRHPTRLDCAAPPDRVAARLLGEGTDNAHSHGVMCCVCCVLCMLCACCVRVVCVCVVVCVVVVGVVGCWLLVAG